MEHIDILIEPIVFSITIGIIEKAQKAKGVYE